MGRYLLRLRRKSVLTLKKQWENHLGSRSRTVPVAMLIGVTAAAAAAVLHNLVALLEAFSAKIAASGEMPLGIIYFLLPLAGLTLSFLSQRIFGGNRYAKSLSPLILALNRRKTSIPLKETFSHIISSALSVGFGGSAGLEAPSVLTGAAIGANTSGFFSMDRNQKKLMIGCGAAAAISAIFQSPVGGVLFAIEVLLPEFSVAALIPMLISSAVAMVVSRALFHHEQILWVINPEWKLDAIPFYFICGIVCALVGVFVIKSVYFITALLKKKLPSPWKRVIAGGFILSAALMMFPILRGQGYHFIKNLFAGNTDKLLQNSGMLSAIPPAAAIIIIIAAAIFLKPAVSALTVESGGDGGIFAPAMFIGAFTGFAFARLINISGWCYLQEENFAVIGMCGVFSAVLRAPLTGVFLIAEVTFSYILLVPLMIVSSVAHAVARWIEPHSVYRKALAEAGLLTNDRDQAMLQILSVRTCTATDYIPVAPDMTMLDLRKVIEKSHGREYFPVINEDKTLAGIVRMEQITAFIFDQHLAETMLVFDLMETPKRMLNEDNDLAEAMKMLEKNRLAPLPVNDRSGKFMGFVCANDIFKLYRGIVRDTDSY